MSNEDPPQSFVSALANEQFILQSVSGTTVGESGNRAALYLSSLSSGLVALGFASGAPDVFRVMLFTVLPTIFVLGCFTTVRLVDTTIENLVAIRRVERIRRYWSTLAPGGAEFFDPDDFDTGQRGVRYGRWAWLFTIASMVIVINSVVAAATTAILCSGLFGIGHITSQVLGSLIGVAFAVVAMFYQWRRLQGPLHNGGKRPPVNGGQAGAVPVSRSMVGAATIDTGPETSAT